MQMQMISMHMAQLTSISTTMEPLKLDNLVKESDKDKQKELKFICLESSFLRGIRNDSGKTTYATWPHSKKKK